eukprot:1158030-Pelagomonas_calceolata.AAC.5
MSKIEDQAPPISFWQPPSNGHALPSCAPDAGNAVHLTRAGAVQGRKTRSVGTQPRAANSCIQSSPASHRWLAIGLETTWLNTPSITRKHLLNAHNWTFEPAGITLSLPFFLSLFLQLPLLQKLKPALQHNSGPTSPSPKAVPGPSPVFGLKPFAAAMASSVYAFGSVFANVLKASRMGRYPVQRLQVDIEQNQSLPAKCVGWAAPLAEQRTCACEQSFVHVCTTEEISEQL